MSGSSFYPGRNTREYRSIANNWAVHTPTGLRQHVVWDMGEAVSISGVSVQTHMRTPTGRVKDYTLSASNDGKVWKQIHTGTFADTPVPQRIRFASPIQARHLKIEATSLYAGNAMILSEIEVYTK